MKIVRLSCLSLLLLGLAPGQAADERKAGADPIKLVPYDFAAYVQVRVAVFFDTPLGKSTAERLPAEVSKVNAGLVASYGLKLGQIESITYLWPKMAADAPVDPAIAVIVTKQPVDRAAMKTFMNVGDATKPGDTSLRLADLLVNGKAAVYFHGPDLVIVATTPKGIEAVVDAWKRKAKHGPLEPATRGAATEQTLAAGACGPNGLPWNWPKGFERLEPLRTATSIGLFVQAREGVLAKAVADFPPGLAADGLDAANQLPSLAKFLSQLPPSLRFLSLTAPLVSAARGELDQQTVHVTALVPPPAAAAIVAQMETDARRADDLSRIRNIAQAMQKYHDEHDQKFPAHATYSKDGKPLLSWRVALLPYLGQKELYEKFHREEPWDSEHNKALVTKMPSVFSSAFAASPRDKGLTHFQLFVGEGAWPKSRDAIGIKNVRDGSANTLMFIQATEPVTWTKPDDLEYDAAKPLPKLAIGGKTALVALFDGSTKALPADWPEKKWRGIITFAGSETVDWPK